MGYMVVMAECFGCKTLFTFNAERVPSVVVDGRREPICRTCVARVNPTRKANGLPVIRVDPMAYEPEEV
jgi:hypothetical protein